MGKFKRWAEGNHIIVIIAIAIVVIFAIAIAFWLSDFLIESKEMLQSVIQAEATIIGFFGITAVYMLTSYDSKIDRLEKQHFDLNLSGERHKVGPITDETKHLKAVRKSAVVSIALTGFMLIFSLITSVITLGMTNYDVRIASSLCMAGLGFFFVGIFMFMIIFLYMSREPEEIIA